MAVPRGLKEGTGPVELEDTTPKDASVDKVQYLIRETIRDSGDPSVVRNNVEPLDCVDRWIICLHRPCSLLQSSRHSHGASVLTASSLEASKAVLVYPAKTR